MNVEKKTIFLGVILFCIIIYIAVSTYGLIVDQFDETVFMIEEGETKIIEGPVHNVINTIKKNLLKKEINKTKEPISTSTNDKTVRKVTLKGRVVYENGTPVPGLMVELQSEPRYTNTDSDGGFIFGDVEEGRHTISVYKEGMMLGKREFIIKFLDNSTAASYEILSDGSLLFVLPNKEMYLSFDIELKDAGGIEIIPSVEVEKSGWFPRRDDVPLTVTDMVDGGDFTNKSEVNIFGDKKLLAPGFSGQYSFRIDNSKNNRDIDCVISLIESQPKGADIPIKYRLQVGGRYIKGDATFYDLEELNRIYASVPSKGSKKYILEWKWVETLEDTKHAQFGGQEYTLTIRVNKL